MSNKVRVVQKMKRLEEKVKRPAALKIGANALQKVLMSPAKKAIRALKYKLSNWFGADFLAHTIEAEYLIKGDIERVDFGTDDFGLQVTFSPSFQNNFQGLHEGDLIEVMSKDSALYGLKAKGLAEGELESDPVAAEAVLDLTNDVTLVATQAGEARNGDTFTLNVLAAADNPDGDVLVEFTEAGGDMICAITPNDGTNNPNNIAAEAVLDLTADITLTSVAKGSARNTQTFTLAVAVAAANDDDEVLVAFTGTAAAIICTVTPNSGANNEATPVNLTTAELAELINTGEVEGKNVVITDASDLRELQTAAGGGATALAAEGEGDGAVATFGDGDEVPVTLTSAEFVELINNGSVLGKNVVITAGNSLRQLQTASGGGATDLVFEGEGDGVSGTFEDGADADFFIAPGGFIIVSDTAIRLEDIEDIDPETDVVFKVKYSAGSRK